MYYIICSYILRASPPAAVPLQLFFLAWQLSALGPILLSDRFHAWMITYSRICACALGYVAWALASVA